LDPDLLAIPPHARIAIIGLGNEFRGDDAAGVCVVRNLQEDLDSPELLIINVGSIPENFTSKVRDFNPTHVILIDTVDFGEKPGTIARVDAGDIAEQAISTHRLPLSMLMSYIHKQTGAEVILIGIQPARVEMGSKMSPQVKEGVKELVDLLTEKLGSL
jgi:hydrogenase maturation protease HycI